MKIEVLPTERALLGYLLAKIHKMDPDLIVVGLGNGGHVFGAWFGVVCCGRLGEWGSCLWCLVWGRLLW